MEKTTLDKLFDQTNTISTDIHEITPITTHDTPKNDNENPTSSNEKNYLSIEYIVELLQRKFN